MRKKYLFSIGVLIAFFCTSLINAQTNTSPIKLDGTLRTGTVKGVSVPVTAFQTANSINIEFLLNLGNLTVTVTNSQNQTVYATTVNTGITRSLPINTNNWASGYYLLTISDMYGGYATYK